MWNTLMNEETNKRIAGNKFNFNKTMLRFTYRVKYLP